MSSFDAARRTMVDCQLRTFDVSDSAVLAAMAAVPREAFVPAGQEHLAYLDRNLVIPGEGGDLRVMLAPMILARLLQGLAVQQGDRALDVAGALGYGAAVFTALGATTTLIESREDLAADAKNRLATSPVTVETGPIESGAKDHGPYDCILVHGSVEERPTALLELLAEGGRLACLSTEESAGRALLYVRSGSGIGYRSLFDARAPVLEAFRRAPAFSF